MTSSHIHLAGNGLLTRRPEEMPLMPVRYEQNMPPIPLILLKTRSTPHDAYQEYFSSAPSTPPTSADDGGRPTFEPVFVPVLEHRPNTENLGQIKALLRKGQLAERYGGMIFTSARAVEGFAGVVGEVERERENEEEGTRGDGDLNRASASPRHKLAVAPSTFPLYAVGPATARQLSALVAAAPRTLGPAACTVRGEQAGNGESLARYILRHYNGLHRDFVFEHYEAPRLPFVPLLTSSSEQYGRKRLERGHESLRKRGLLFLVGETRRNVIPRTLDVEERGEERIQVEEVEVYNTDVADGFEGAFKTEIASLEQDSVVVVVVFSPQGCEAMLKVLGFVDGNGRTSANASQRSDWSHDKPRREDTRFVIVTIGPTTRDHLRDKFGFETDVCAATPSPKGVRDGLMAFLKARGGESAMK